MPSQALIVRRLIPGQPSKVLQEGDLILAVDGTPVNTFMALEACVQRPTAQVTILRDAVEQTLSVGCSEVRPTVPRSLAGARVRDSMIECLSAATLQRTKPPLPSSGCSGAHLTPRRIHPANMSAPTPTAFGADATPPSSPIDWPGALRRHAAHRHVVRAGAAAGLSGGPRARLLASRRGRLHLLLFIRLASP